MRVHYLAGINYDGSIFQSKIPIIRSISVIVYFFLAVLSIWFTQLLGYPLSSISLTSRFFSRWMNYTKQLFALLIISITQWMSPASVRIFTDKSMGGDVFSLDARGCLSSTLQQNERNSIIISNHQLYTDWIYLWWIAYSARLHGAIHIFMKGSLRSIPLLGRGMANFNFIFLNRKWQKDRKLMDKQLDDILSSNKIDPTTNTKSQVDLRDVYNKSDDDKHTFIFFPEGTNLAECTRVVSDIYAKKIAQPPMNNVLLPRSTGLRFLLEKLDAASNGKDQYLYDCTIWYSGFDKTEYGQDLYTLKSVYLYGTRYPSTISMYWRRFNIKDIPYQDPQIFDQWLRDIYYEKDRLLDTCYETNGSFVDPSVSNSNDNQVKEIKTCIQLSSNSQTLRIFAAPLLLIAMYKLRVIDTLWSIMDNSLMLSAYKFLGQIGL